MKTAPSQLLAFAARVSPRIMFGHGGFACEGIFNCRTNSNDVTGISTSVQPRTQRGFEAGPETSPNARHKAVYPPAVENWFKGGDGPYYAGDSIPISDTTGYSTTSFFMGHHVEKCFVCLPVPVLSTLLRAMPGFQSSPSLKRSSRDLLSEPPQPELRPIFTEGFHIPEYGSVSNGTLL